jgi:25S rRNA (uracil2843-N3)-methyltransferase
MEFNSQCFVCDLHISLTMPSTSSTPSARRKGSRVLTSTKPSKPRKPQAQPTNLVTTATNHTFTRIQTQEIVTIFHNTFSSLFTTPSLQNILQTIKHHLYNRDYAAAFDAPNLPAYAARWSPSRALCYTSIFLDLHPALRSVFSLTPVDKEIKRTVVSIGGGAGAELVAMSAAVKALGSKGTDEGRGRLHLKAIDRAAWTEPFESLQKFVETPCFSATFQQSCILTSSPPVEIPDCTQLITLLFTTNELYTQSRVQTTAFLLSLAPRVQSGCLLLVVESAGSYSTVKIGEKEFPMVLLLEHTLLGGETGGCGEDWERIFADDSRWYRIPNNSGDGESGRPLRYPLALENMRYFVRLFQKL